MSALVRSIPSAPLARKVSPDRARALPERRTFGGFGPSAGTPDISEQLGGAALTVLLVLYPAVASVAVVLAALVLSGAGLSA